jgi:hypothetical protein
MRQTKQVPARSAARSISFLEGPFPEFDGPSIQIEAGLSVHKVDKPFLMELESRGVANVTAIAGGCKVCVQFQGTDSIEDLLRPNAFQEALVIATDVRAQEKTHIVIDLEDRGNHTVTTSTNLPARGTILWGHHRESLTENEVKSAKRLLPGIEHLQSVEKFSRVANAVLFYRNGYNSDNPDLALVAFTTCLESLFSTAEQELSFRLSLRVASFLADKSIDREAVFHECKEVYKIRSKVVHGAAITRDSEQAAIYLVDSIVPQAERLARRTLAKVLEMQLEPLFENASKLNVLFDRLLFSDSFEKTLAEIRTKS